MFGRLDVALQLAVLAAWAILVAMLFRPAPGIAATLLGAGLLLASINFLVRRQALQTGRRPADERSARLMVTQMLAELTRVQLAYLKQSFSSPDDGQRWLKRALPRSYGDAVTSLTEDLERYRGGKVPDALRLVARLRELRPKLKRRGDALEARAAEHSGCELALPAAFVITEEIEARVGFAEPKLVLVASWNPTLPTLIPEVDQLTVIGTSAVGKATVQGKIELAEARERWASRFTRLRGQGREAVYLYTPNSGDQETPQWDALPLGFVLRADELEVGG